ncbi:hypothetical protein [Streptomyces sp. 891-h]|uniref:hypothetical protein n=1 Tax=unclassified Streptomyces TaxID=2593676 RepID=UPI001FAA1BA0|nr:hypothetical protein [Streptomyces sp. 891-h]UNZ19105.1 hypothetical protein HC362_20690 [Streptomyces sp. 891-h]
MGGNGESGGSPSPGTTPGGHLPPNTDLVHSESKKRAAARYIAETLGPETQKAGSKADEDTESLAGNPQSPTTVRGKLHGWELWTGVRHRLTKWREHHKHLTQMLANEREALLDVNKILNGTDVANANSVTSATSGLTDPEGPKLRPKSGLDKL